MPRAAPSFVERNTMHAVVHDATSGYGAGLDAFTPGRADITKSKLILTKALFITIATLSIANRPKGFFPS
ncbi:MAG: hypothetical protein ACXWNZ_10750 [Vulcanimicrobiaceae bacterium]